jgi:hypothetical protein
MHWERTTARLKHRRLYGGTFKRRSLAVRQAAYANPKTKCRRCGLTYAEGVNLWGEERAAWQAGHVIDGHPGSPLCAEHAYCNQAAGAAKGHHRDVPSPNA